MSKQCLAGKGYSWLQQQAYKHTHTGTGAEKRAKLLDKLMMK